MADISLTRNHTLGVAEARNRADTIMAELKSELPNLLDSISWDGSGTNASFTGTGFEGTIALTDTTATINVELSLLTKALKGPVTGKIDARMSQHFA